MASSSLLFSRQEIATGIREVAKKINTNFASSEVVLVGVMKGCVPFIGDLAKALSIPCRMEYLFASSYGNDVSPSLVYLHHATFGSLKGENVIIVDDIMDTGRTMEAILSFLQGEEVTNISTCVLVNKRARREVDIDPTYSCLELETNNFVVGYGLDDAGYKRNLQDIYAMETHEPV